MKKFHLLLIFVTIAELLLPSRASFAFSDVQPNSYYTEAVMNLAERGIISGGTDGKFRPNDYITRGQVAKVVARSLKIESHTDNTIKFSDVSLAHEFYPYITGLAESQIINGYTNGSFGINDYMTRAQAAKVLTLAFELPVANVTSSPFNDISNNSLKQYIETLYAYGVTNGISATQFGPNETITRGSLAVMIRRIEQLKVNDTKVISYQSLQGKEVNVKFEYENSREYIAISNSIKNQTLTFTPLKQGVTTVLFEVKNENNEIQYIKKIVKITESNGILTMTFDNTKEIEAAQFVFNIDEFVFIPTNVTITKIDGSQTNTVEVIKQDNLFYITFYATGDYLITFTNNQNETSRVSVNVISDLYSLKGKAYFEQKLLTKEMLGVNLSNATLSLVLDETNTTPVSVTQSSDRILIQPLTVGSTYLKIVVDETIYYYIIEVTKYFGQFVIEIYETI